jgi:hypothetical protein
MLMVSDETHDMTATESDKPSIEYKHMTARSMSRTNSTTNAPIDKLRTFTQLGSASEVRKRNLAVDAPSALIQFFEIRPQRFSKIG